MPTENQGSSDPFASMEDAVSAFVGTDEEKPPVTDKPEPETTDEEIASDDIDLELADEEGDAKDEEDDGSEPEPSGGRFVSDDAKVKLEDGSVITVADLRKGNLFQADWTRKSMALAEEKKSFDNQKTQIQQLEQALLQQRETVAVVAAAFMPKPPDPALMDPNSDKFDIVGYTTQKAAYEHQASLVNRLLSDHQMTQQRRQQEQEKSFEETVKAEQQKLYQRAPELAKPETYQKFWTDAVAAGQEYGFTPDEMNAMTDHRYYLALKDATAYRRLKAKHTEAKAKTNGKPPVLTGSNRRSPEAVRQQESKAAIARLNQSGKLSDGVAALLALEKE